MAVSDLVVSETQGVTVVSFRNPSILDSAAVEKIGDELYAIVEQQAKRKILLDFAQVRFLSSQMLGVLLALHQKSGQIKGKVIIAGLQPKLFEVFKIMKLHKLLQFADTEEQGLSCFDSFAKR